MIQELKAGVGKSVNGIGCVVSSRYKVSEDCEVVTVKGADWKWDDGILVVTTDGENSLPFDILLSCDEEMGIVQFVHIRERVAEGVKSVNTVAPTLRPKLSEVKVVSPSLEELNVAPRELPREGF